MTKEELRLQEDRDRKKHWKRWGPYLSERAWGTVREDYSSYGTAWDSFHTTTHAHAPTVGTKMELPVFATGTRTSALHWLFGTATIPF